MIRGFRKIPCVIQRGGTSKGIFLHDEHLPKDPELRKRVILAIFGSPDKRQIDGLGGADPLTSKVAIIGPSARSDADVDYTFGAVDINMPIVDFKGNCGNISSGVGPFAIDEGLVKVQGSNTVVRIYNTNTQKILKAHVPTWSGGTEYSGDYAIDGVPGTGAKISLDYSATGGSATGKVLPTGNVTDIVAVPSIGNVEMSIVDVANPGCFIRPEVLNLSGIEGPLDKRIVDLLDKIELIRGTAATMIGLASDPRKARLEAPSVPFVAMVSPAKDYSSFSDGSAIKARDIDFVLRAFYMQEMHKACGGTMTVCAGAAAMIKGTLVNNVCSERAARTKTVCFGHPSGTISIEVDVVDSKDGIRIEKAAFGRTSRRIMEGFVYVPESLFPA